jgi:Tfp pilus assembly protein PilV
MIEVMIAMLLAVIAVIGLVGLFSVNARASRGSRHTTEAAVLAEDQMEILRTQSAPVAGSETGLDALGAPGGIFTRAWTVVSGATEIEYTVTVSWNEDGPTRNVTLRSKRGP